MRWRVGEIERRGGGEDERKRGGEDERRRGGGEERSVSVEWLCFLGLAVGDSSTVGSK